MTKKIMEKNKEMNDIQNLLENLKKNNDDQAN